MCTRFQGSSWTFPGMTPVQVVDPPESLRHKTAWSGGLREAPVHYVQGWVPGSHTLAGTVEVPWACAAHCNLVTAPAQSIHSTHESLQGALCLRKLSSPSWRIQLWSVVSAYYCVPCMLLSLVEAQIWILKSI